jgi:outer membrane protein assembly factor BamA
LDHLNRKDTVSELWWYVGSRYTWTHLRLGREASALPVNTGLKPSSVFSPGAYDRLCRRLLAWGADNGYPFALVRLDSIVVLNGVLQAQLVFDRGPLVTFDSLLIRGEPKVRKRYLENQIEIHAGEPYSDRLVGRIGSRLKEVPFISEARPAEVEFSGNKARPVLFLKDKKASQFNGVIGVQPDNAGTGKVYVTGDLRLRLQNAFGRAELVELNWGNPQPRSQDLKVKVAVPFVVDLPVGVEGAFDLYKKDTTFLELNQSFGVRYILGPADALVLTIGRKSSRLIDTERFRNTTVLPEFADVNVNQVGLGFQLTRLDYRLNPRKGVSLELEGQSGIRNITRNPAIPETVYDSISLRTSQARARLAVDAYLPIRGNAVFNVGCMGSWLKSNTIFTNELYRFGGLRTLRGFDEQSLTASAFGILKSELRYIIDTNSYLLVFGNLAWYRDESKPVVFEDRPYGFGAGITFETNVGIFAFTYALGSQQGNPIEFRSGKIHFGLLNTF